VGVRNAEFGLRNEKQKAREERVRKLLNAELRIERSPRVGATRRVARIKPEIAGARGARPGQ
jgi:hypothetical protein